MGGAKAVLATVTSAQAMEAIAGGLGANGTMMVIGAVGPNDGQSDFAGFTSGIPPQVWRKYLLWPRRAPFDF